MRTFDAVVLGLGSIGSFTALELARRGLRVAGFDQFAPPHNRGSHSGDTRVFRVAYAEHPGYVALAQRAGTLWDRFGEAWRAPLLTRCGMLTMGSPSGNLIGGIRASAAQYGIPVEKLSPNEIRHRYPAFAVPEEFAGVFEAGAGWIDVDASIRGAIDAAEQNDACIFRAAPVTAWRKDGAQLVIETPVETFATGKLILCAGAWSGTVLRDLGLPLRVQRKILAWIDPVAPENFAPGRFPVFVIGDRFFYGFPNLGGNGVKLAIHWEGEGRFHDPSEPVAPPIDADLAPILDMASQYLRGLGSRVTRSTTCLYTMTPDEHFIIDRHPSHENVWIAAGFSGHGFKFAPVIAEVLADLCTSGKTALPIELFRIGRRFAAVASEGGERTAPGLD